MIKSILVPIDGSEHAEKAAMLAGDIAEKYDAEVVLLHVAGNGGRLPKELRRMAEIEHLIDPSQGGKPLPAGTPGDTAAAVRDSSDQDISAAAATRIGQWLLERSEQIVRKTGAKSVKRRLEFGDPAELIVDCAREAEANLIVMGSRGLSDLKGLLMGSVSHKVSHLSKCTCITVK